MFTPAADSPVGNSIPASDFSLSFTACGQPLHIVSIVKTCFFLCCCSVLYLLEYIPLSQT